MLRDRWWFGRKTPAFTLQWHLTNACPYHCAHCYDRSPSPTLSLAQARGVVRDLRAFCRKHRVQPRISLTGGDPFLWPDFWEFYTALARGAMPVSILGNPISAEIIQRLLAIHPPTYYQVSLEGLAEHNDRIRGAGHYLQVMEFLAAAQKLGLRATVMLTLTRANLDQVLPLGEELRERTARFSFNRLSQVGQAAEMAAPTPAQFAAFLPQYLRARRGNPILGVKDNLFNIIRHHFQRPLFPGCTGFGCGAAFNFLALLPDGEVHACRKFPSPLGHIQEASLEAIYHSAAAQAYRRGPEPCHRCKLRNRCGGCLAVSFGAGLDPLKNRDPYCFWGKRAEVLTDLF